MNNLNIDTSLLKKGSKRGVKKKVTGEQIELMKKWREEGYTVSSIAKALGYSSKTISTYLNK